MDDDTPRAGWHAIEADEALRRLRSSRDGLSRNEADKRIESAGLNRWR